ncbi:MAG: hypothetical protein EPO36_05535 [Chloroflexota bacterium]|nr:MAG: hypothetical protein EPO36_05535 [Chloroflexota bacterium]
MHRRPRGGGDHRDPGLVGLLRGRRRLVRGCGQGLAPRCPRSQPRRPWGGERPGRPVDGDGSAGSPPGVARGVGDGDRRPRRRESGEAGRADLRWPGRRPRDGCPPVHLGQRPRREQARERPGSTRAAHRTSRGGRRVTRSAAEIGAGLAQAREARPIRLGERIHVVGAAGAGASAAALHAAWAGAVVTACDAGGPSPYTAAFAEAGLELLTGHAAAHVTTTPPPDRLAVTKALTAIAPDHPELQAARAAGIPIEPWQQVVADAAYGKRLVAVAGTHGKSTTAGWLLAAVPHASAFVGALLPSVVGAPSTAIHRADAKRFVVEADEYAGNFDPYRPSIAVLTSVEWDHPDVFADELAVRDAFDAWIRRSAWHDGHRPVLVANIGDRGARLVAEQLSGWEGGVLATQVLDEDASPGPAIAAARERYRTGGGPAEAIVATITALDPGGTTLEIFGLPRAGDPLVVRLATAGRHNAANALTVIGVASLLGGDPVQVARGVGRFRGVGRRLERKGEAAGVVVYDDYGHHPTAISVTIAAVRQREPGRRVWAVYEPLTFHRTAALLEDFAVALATADAVAVADIWAGRDTDTTVASSAALAEAVARRRPGIPHGAPGSVEATADWLAGQVAAGDVVLVMGGGQSYRIGERLLAALSKR